ncbi:MAG TPA: hypothetical protein VKB42_14955, partial [Dongiaceae bacterium]|nr:hypothetical protein [Dongiaceae bacterium]
MVRIVRFQRPFAGRGPWAARAGRCRRARVLREHAFFWGGFGGITPHSSTPAPTLVGPAGGLQFDLVWDPSVADAPKGFQQAIVNAALSYTKLFSDDIVIKIRVGYGEVAGSKLDAGALGESESNYMLVSYATVAGALAGDNYPLTLARNEPTT